MTTPHTPMVSRHDAPTPQMISHLHGDPDGDAHKRKSADGRPEEYIRRNEETVEAQAVRCGAAATHEAFRQAMANAPQL